MSLLERSALPIRHSRQSTESLPGYIYRLYNANGHAVPTEIHAGLSSLYSAAAQDHREWAATQVSAISGGLDYADWPQWRTQHRWLKQSYVWARFCPLCMKDNPIHQSIWELPLVKSCPTHQTMLSQRCDCGRKLAWRTIRADWRCRCGKGVAEQAPVTATPEQVALAHFISSPYGNANNQTTNSDWSAFSGLASRYEEILLIHQLTLKCSNRLYRVPGPKTPDEMVGRLLTDWPNQYVAYINQWLDMYFGGQDNHFVRLAQNSPLIRVLKDFSPEENKPALTSWETLRVTLEQIRVPLDWNGTFLIRPTILANLSSAWLDDFKSMVSVTSISTDEEDFSGASSNDCQQTKLLRGFVNRFISISCMQLKSTHFRHTAFLWPERPYSSEKSSLGLLAHLIAPLYRASPEHLSYLSKMLEKDYIKASTYSQETSHV